MLGGEPDQRQVPPPKAFAVTQRDAARSAARFSGRPADWLDGGWWLTSGWRTASLAKWLANWLKVIVTLAVFISKATNILGKVRAAGPELGFHSVMPSTQRRLNPITQAIGSNVQKMTSLTALKLYNCTPSQGHDLSVHPSFYNRISVQTPQELPHILHMLMFGWKTLTC